MLRLLTSLPGWTDAPPPLAAHLLSAVPIPEPAALGLLAVGVVGLLVSRRWPP